MAAPLILAAGAGIFAIIAGVTTYEVTKAVSESDQKQEKEQRDTLNGMIKKINSQGAKGELGSALVAFKEAIEYSKEHAHLNHTTPRLERELEQLKARINTQIDKLEPEFLKAKKQLLSNGDFSGTHRIFNEFIGKLRGLLAPDSPFIKAYEKDYEQFNGPTLKPH